MIVTSIQADSEIQIRGLSHTYAGADEPVLHDVDLTIEGGSFFGLLGPNGAGKTTLISLLTGILPVRRGEVSILGRSLSKDASAVKALTGLVPQDYAFYPALTGLENMEYFAGINGLNRTQTRARIRECAALCGLGDVMHRRAKQYSGGLKRRLNLAIGLLNEPRVLYLDEPTVGIDAESRRFILDAIKALKSEGNTIVYTSHYMEEVEQLCDTVAIIDHGRLIVRERMSELIRTGTGEGVLIELRKPLTGEQLRHSVLTKLKQRETQLYGRITPGELAAVLAHLQASGAIVERVQFGTRPLEQVYLRLIQDEGRA